MPRPPRHHLPGATYHVMLRGNNGQSIFQSDSDRCHLCLLIQEAVERYGCHIVAFCFMTNHLHLAIEAGEASLSEIFQTLAGRYSRYFNRRHEARGHLFQGRFHSLLVSGQIYLRKLIRYIHLNPVKAGLVDAPELYTWSSHAAYLDETAFTWLAVDRGLKHFGRSRAEATSRFRNFVVSGIGHDEVTDFLKGCRDGILGEDSFIEWVTNRAKLTGQKPKISLQSLLEGVGHHYDLEPTSLKIRDRNLRSTRIRAMTAFLAREMNGVTLEELATFFGQGASSLSKAAARIARKASNSPDIRSELNAVREALQLSSGSQA